MTAQQASKRLLIAGGAGAFASLIWCKNFYTQIDQFLGHKGSPPIECLYQLTGPCRMVANVANFFGARAYDPRLLWLSGFALALSIVFEVVASKTKQSAPR
jgi:hypothetical protein